jgi:hypothetical protein
MTLIHLVEIFEFRPELSQDKPAITIGFEKEPI